MEPIADSFLVFVFRDAWNSLGEMAKEEAMAAYVDDLKLVLRFRVLSQCSTTIVFQLCCDCFKFAGQILESMPVTNEVEELLQVIGPFYELVDEKRKITQVSDLSTGKLTHGAFKIIFCTKRKQQFVIRSVFFPHVLHAQ